MKETLQSSHKSKKDERDAIIDRATMMLIDVRKHGLFSRFMRSNERPKVVERRIIDDLKTACERLDSYNPDKRWTENSLTKPAS